MNEGEAVNENGDAVEIRRLWQLIHAQTEEARRLRVQLERAEHAQLTSVCAELQLMHGRL